MWSDGGSREMRVKQIKWILSCIIFRFPPAPGDVKANVVPLVLGDHGFLGILSASNSS